MLGSVSKTVEEIPFYRGETPNSYHWSMCSPCSCPCFVWSYLCPSACVPSHVCSGAEFRFRVWGALLRRSSSEETIVPGRGHESYVAGSWASGLRQVAALWQSGEGGMSFGCHHCPVASSGSWVGGLAGTSGWQRVMQ